MPVVGVIILAAGASSRMGQPKQTLSYQGKPLLARIIETALETDCGPVVVVTGANTNLIAPIAAAYPVQTAFNSAWAEGMNTSIRVGLNAVQDFAENLDAVLIATCDQPFVSAALFRRLVQVYAETGKPIVTSEYAGTRGVPALFDRTLFAELQNLPAGAGAGRLIARQSSEQIAAVPFPEGAIDMDTPEDFARLSSFPVR